MELEERVRRDIAALAERHGIRSVILFGSRARGDCRERSDIDLAVRGGDVTGFSCDADEEVRTLLWIDIVDLDRDISEELRGEIDRDGIVLYKERLMKRYEKKYENFCRALGNLEEGARLEEPYSVVEQAGIAALFEICFEQSWKLIKEVLEVHGIFREKIGSPRMILKTAYQSGMISESEDWLNLLETRNILAHSYSDEQSLRAIREVRARYLPLFRLLKEEIDTRWMN